MHHFPYNHERAFNLSTFACACAQRRDVSILSTSVASQPVETPACKALYQFPTSEHLANRGAQPRGSRFALLMLSSIRRTVQPFESLRPAAAGLPILPRFYRQLSLIDADRPKRQSAPRHTRLTAPTESSNGPSRENRLRAATQVIHRLVDADPKRFPFDNFKPFSPAFRPTFHLSLTLLVRYRARCHI